MESDYHSKISSAAFLKIMEGGINTFMNFLKADKEKSCEILTHYFRRNKRGMVDPTLLKLMKKVNQKVCSKFETNFSFIFFYETPISETRHAPILR